MTDSSDYFGMLKDGELTPADEIEYIDYLKSQVKGHKYDHHDDAHMTLGELKTELDELQVYEDLHPAHRHDVSNMRKDVERMME